MAQKFPELKANEQYQRLIDSIQACERELEIARQKFNKDVKAYNVQRSSIPYVFFSAALGFRDATYLEFTGAEQTSDMGTLKSFSNDADGERLNQLLSNAGGKALELGGKALEGSRIISTKAIEGSKVLVESAQEKIREYKEKGSMDYPSPPPPPPPIAEQETLYYYLDSDRRAQGPVSLKLIQDKSREGQLPSDVLVALVGSSSWVTLSSIVG